MKPLRPFPLVYDSSHLREGIQGAGAFRPSLDFTELAVSGLRLIGDIGGTNARFAIAENGTYRELKHVEVDRYPSLHDALSDYLGTLSQGERAQLAGALAIAGPVLGDSISMTNKAWSFSIAELMRSLNLTSLV